MVAANTLRRQVFYRMVTLVSLRLRIYRHAFHYCSSHAEYDRIILFIAVDALKNTGLADATLLRLVYAGTLYH